jgi:serine O-acetyltransferase
MTAHDPETVSTDVVAAATASAADQPLPLGDRNANPPDIGFLPLLAEDFRTHGSSLTSPGFWAVATHRFGNWRMGVQKKSLRGPMSVAYRAAHWAATALWGIDLPYNAKIGRRFHIVHHGAVFVGSREIGDDVCIRHAVTIGLKRKTERRAPRIGSRVEIGPGACIVGDIEVGDDCLIGANTVLAQNAPSGSTVLGVPGRFVELARHLDPPPRP